MKILITALKFRKIKIYNLKIVLMIIFQIIYNNKILLIILLKKIILKNGFAYLKIFQLKYKEYFHQIYFNILEYKFQKFVKLKNLILLIK